MKPTCRTFFACFVLFSCLFSGNISYALGQSGHQIVCQLAFDNLPPPQQRSLMAWVAQIPAKDKRRINRALHRDKDTSLVFADASVWADAIRDIEDYNEFSPWHYLNVQRDSSKIANVNCPRGCIVQAIITHDQHWRQKPDAKDRLQALLFISHWIADIHQPLHVSFQSDRGGNTTQVIDNSGQCSNLHQIWDTCLVNDIGLTSQQWQKSFIDYQKTRVNQSNLSNPALTLELVVGWANESLSISRHPDVQYCHYQTGPWCHSSATAIHYNPLYIRNNKHRLKQQILLAALRLKAYLAATI
ncbi:S1/P1 nuclease [Thalassotalea litorea]|uniref:S1/P1 nuclease n=1 Tax=Thalassotalea litorea TaxID=2020715 RepID=UPI0037361313